MADDAERAHIRGNRAHWDRKALEYQRLHAATLDRPAPAWGAWAIPEDDLEILGDVRGLDVLEVGCGGGHWAVHLARRGARIVGLDLSSRQLDHAREHARRAGVAVTFVEGDVERLPFEGDRFDLVFSDHGAMTFAEPRRSLPEVARVLRSDGRLCFNITSPVLDVCWDDRRQRVSERLHANYFAMSRFLTGDETSFNLPYGEWIRLLRGAGFVVEDLVELRPPAGAETTFVHFVPEAWARRWPAENIWVTRKRA